MLSHITIPTLHANHDHQFSFILPRKCTVKYGQARHQQILGKQKRSAALSIKFIPRNDAMGTHRQPRANAAFDEWVVLPCAVMMSEEDIVPRSTQSLSCVREEITMVIRNGHKRKREFVWEQTVTPCVLIRRFWPVVRLIPFRFICTLMSCE